MNEYFANRYWPGQNVVGKRFRLRNATGPWVEIIGLVKTTKYSFLLESPIEFIYFSAAQRPQSMMALVVETEGEPAAAAPLIRAAVGEIDANQPIYNLRTVEDTYQMRVVSILNIIVRFVGAMGLMGLVLAIVGLYGLVSYAVSRRTKEIGIRMAIGADRDSILRMMLGHGGMLAVAGLAVGLIASAGAARAMRGIFPAQDTAQGSASGPIAYVLVSLMVLIVTLLAAYLPARRAASINPTERSGTNSRPSAFCILHSAFLHHPATRSSRFLHAGASSAFSVTSAIRPPAAHVSNCRRSASSLRK